MMLCSAGGVLGHVEHAEPRIEHVHLGRRLGVGRELEDDLHAVDRVLLDRLHDDLVGAISDGAARDALAEAGVDLAARAPRQHAAELELARRIIGVPASTFSLVTSSMNPSGAMMATLPALTSASSTTPRTPP